MLDVIDFYDKMERNNILLSFKGEITSELVSSVLAIIEAKLEETDEKPATKRKVYNVLVEALQNLYHHMDSIPSTSSSNADSTSGKARTAVFLIGRAEDGYVITTANYIVSENISKLKGRLDKINSLDREGLRAYYQETLDDGQFSIHGGGGLGMIDIARKSGHKLDYQFKEVSEEYSFFTLNIKIATKKQ